jgi:hypothetical protein
MNRHLLARLHLRCFLRVNARTMVVWIEVEEKREGVEWKIGSNNDDQKRMERKEGIGKTYPNGVIATLTRLSPRTLRR